MTIRILEDYWPGSEWRECSLEVAAMYLALERLAEINGAYVGATQADSDYIWAFIDEVMG